MLFSIVIPLYNGAKFIEHTLDSVLSQTYKNYEIVLVNDGSPDNVGEVVKRYIACHSGIKFIYLKQKNKGLGGARNTAIKHANGEVIAILDQDDIWYPNKLEKVYAAYQKYPNVSIVCHDQYIRENGKIKCAAKTGPYEKDMYSKLLFKGNRISTSATTFKRSAIENVGYFSEDVDNLHFVEDYELWLRMALNKSEFFFLPEFLGEYILHDNNYIKMHEKIASGEIYVINMHYKLLKHKKAFDWYRLRMRKADILFVLGYKLIKLDHSYLKGIIYIFKSFIADPLFFLGMIYKYFQVHRRSKK
ncbi:MAG: glycosyltransferase [Candidatus Omnitrophica bacterium]|nr:glycosyltransferase [Candidatus Omnitrophota bacterium]